MAQRNRAQNPDRHLNVVDLRVLDLFAQIECVMRHAREVQREVIRYREQRAVGGSNARVANIKRRVGAVSREARALQSVVAQVSDAADDLSVATRPQRKSDMSRRGRLSVRDLSRGPATTQGEG